MGIKARIFSSELSGTERLVYGTVAILYAAIFFATIWPIYPLFSRIRPLVFSMPFSLFYLLILVAVGFFSLLALYL